MNRIYFVSVSLAICILVSISGYGQINFIGHLISDNTHGIACISACDLDNDSDQDILAASNEDNQVIWFRNDGGDTIKWTKIIIANNVYSAHSVCAADIDGDNDLDIIGAAYWNKPGISWWRNNGGDSIIWEKFIVANDFINAHEVFVCDLDNDNDMDVLGASSDLNMIAWWRNDGGDTITWKEYVFSDDVTLAKTVSAGDFDKDGDLDVIGASIIDNDIFLWRNDGGFPIVWTEFLIEDNFFGAHKLQSIDLDKDGDEDILGAGYLGHEVAWWRNDGGDTISWVRQDIASSVMNACVASAGDLDNDGDLDVVGTAQGSNEILWWMNVGDYSSMWPEYSVDNNFLRPWPLAIADFDGDSDLDVVSGSSYNGSNIINWYENDIITSLKRYPDKSQISIFPNPADNRFCVDLLNVQNSIDLVLVNSIGKIVLRKSISELNPEKRFCLNVDGLPSGIYFLQIFGEDMMASKKLIISHN